MYCTIVISEVDVTTAEEYISVSSH